jgi:hypothetical protein
VESTGVHVDYVGEGKVLVLSRHSIVANDMNRDFT